MEKILKDAALSQKAMVLIMAGMNPVDALCQVCGVDKEEFVTELYNELRAKGGQ